MKILIYENSAGFSSYTSKLCEELVKNNDVTVDYLTVPNNKYLENFDERIKIIPILKDFNAKKKNSLSWFFNRVLVSLSNIVTRNRFCKKNKYDAVSIQSTIPIIDQFFIKSFCKKNKNVVYTVHDVIPPIKSFYWTKKSLGKVYRNCGRLIVHTGGNKTQMVQEFAIEPSKINVIHHGTDVDRVILEQDSCKEQLGLTRGKITILFYGLIRKQKGLDVLIEALRGLDGVQLLIAGAMPYGENFDGYQSLIEINGVDTRQMIEFVPENMTDAIFNSCDFVCLPYKYFYSQSGVFMQCIKYRKPVIVSDVSSFKEYIGKYDIGLLCEPNSVSDLREKILKMVEILKRNPNHFVSGLDCAAFENSWKAAADKYLEVLLQRGVE